MEKFTFHINTLSQPIDCFVAEKSTIIKTVVSGEKLKSSYLMASKKGTQYFFRDQLDFGTVPISLSLIPWRIKVTEIGILSFLFFS